MKNIRILSFILFIIFSQKAQAYIDPGSGSIIFQVIIASILTIGYTFKSLFLKLWGKNKDNKPNE